MGDLLPHARFAAALILAGCAPRVAPPPGPDRAPARPSVAFEAPASPDVEVDPPPSTSNAPERPSAAFEAPASPDVEVDPPPSGTVRLMMVGDMMLGSTWPDASGGRLPPDDAAQLLAPVTELVSSADVAIGNLEGPLYDGGDRPECTPSRIAEYYDGGTGPNCFAFRMPERYSSLLARTGFDVLSLANNHARDYGDAGFEATARVLEGVGITPTGALGSVASRSVGDVRLAVLAFAPYEGLNPMDPADDVADRVRAAAASHDVVVVSFHGGAEGPEARHVPRARETFHGEDRGDVRAFAHAAVDAGADVVFGHGPHVVRGLEAYRGRIIAYSLGNFASWRGVNVSGPRGLSFVLDVELDARGELVRGQVHPIRQPRPGARASIPTDGCCQRCASCRRQTSAATPSTSGTTDRSVSATCPIRASPGCR
ncbi:MAG: CapA family protein [Sandaracinaceae bacterium]|nr:CapA family protein [Sandaracinaceae bacterium]